jgi:hypothetical protein
MRDVQTPAAIRATLQYVLGSDVPAEHKSILIDALTRLLRTEESVEDDRRRDAETNSRAWQPHEINHLDRSLCGKVAKSWQDADETLIHVASQLQRRSADVRAKALELGFTAAVDFAVAKATRASREHE